MIEIQEKANLQFVYFPRSTSGVSDTYTLALDSELTQNLYLFSGLTDESRSKNYYKIKVDLHEVNDGEYNYRILGDDQTVLSTGLLKIGEVTDDIPSRAEYNPFVEDCGDCNEIVQYYPQGNFKYRFQDKELTVIENGNYTILADSGYNAIHKVELSVEIPIEGIYESGYTSGYTDGYEDGYDSGKTDGFEDGYDSGHTDGVTEQKSKLASITVVDNGEYTKEDGYSAVTVNVPVQDYYNSGYTSGRTDGIEEQKSKLSAITIDVNGEYIREDGYSAVTVNINTVNNQDKTIDVIDNGVQEIEPDSAHTGLGKVTVNTNVPVQDYFDSGYTSGHTDGIDYQKSRLSAVTLDENGYYTRTDGYSAITVSVPVNDYYNSGYTSGYTDGHTSGVTDGVNEQKSKLTSTAVTDNGTYTREDGYSAFTVNVPINDYYNSGYTSGVTDGIDEQKAKLSAATFTSNGVYTKEDGYSAVTVSVPSDIHNQNKSFSATTNGEFTVHADTGYSGLGEVAIKVDVPTGDYYNSGYTSGYTDGHTSGVTDGVNEQKSKLSADTFTVNGTYTRTDGYSAVTVAVEQTGYTPADMAEAYASGVTSGVTLQKSKLITTAVTSNGTFSREDGYSEIVVNVSSGSIVHNQTKAISATTNGFHEVTYDYGYTGLENVSIYVDVSGYTEADMATAYASGETHQKSLLTSTAVTENGTYTRTDGYSAITVNVPTGSTIINQNKSVTISANTTTAVTFDAGYTGLGTVTISGDFDEEGWYNSGYTDGHVSGVTDGINEQKAKLISTAITSNGVYERADGYSAITVNVPQTGSTINNQNKTITVSSNTVTDVTYDNGYTGLGTVTVIGSFNTSVWYNSGKTDGIVEQKAKLSAITITENTAITRADGYSAVTVNVPVQDYFDSGYTSGYSQGYTDGYNAASTGYSSQYFTVEIISGASDSVIRLETNSFQTYYNIEVSINNGEWISKRFGLGDGNEKLISGLTTGDIIRFRGSNASYNGASFGAANDITVSVYGNIMSLISGDNYATASSFAAGSSSNFAGFFANNTISNQRFKLVYANNLVLPATVLTYNCYRGMFENNTTLVLAPSVLPAITLAESCYRSMFQGCTVLTAAPELPATTLAYESYYSMFSACYSLNYIKCLATTNISGNTNLWTSSVAASGTFIYKLGTESIWSSGDNGIPSGWNTIGVQ